MTEYPELTTTAKQKILGLNAARLYDIDVPAGLEAKVPAEPDAEVAVGAPEVAVGASA
jgi:hypothetical protein